MPADRRVVDSLALHIVAERAFGIGNEEQGEHVTHLLAQGYEGQRPASNYL